ncbi:MAG: PVC-type heme-binding CxxCH protein [Pirellulales bacterium]
MCAQQQIHRVLVQYVVACVLALEVLLATSTAYTQGLSADQAVQRMKLAGGFEASVVASEPLVRQPVAIEFDDRGRLWVIQYLQYPNPEGLKRVQVDRYSRTKYDRVPEPPPRGPRGADRITILEDTDGDGRMDRGRDFVEGLNLTTGIAFGYGGVFVLNVPYLLFYPDRNRDDIPDSAPEVLLTGFGMEDAHSVANSLTWGPDGWLYGCQGSTVTANIRGIEFQQGVWRYHPATRVFELFCEGGGNSWGLDFDRIGRLLYSTNFGGHTLLHGVQGGYYVKSFGKHGALHNPHAYGYFEHAPHRHFRGGHVTVGGVVYQADAFPSDFRGKYIAGDLLGHGVYWHLVESRGSTVQTAHGSELLLANDPWFAPTDVTVGPDGAVYVTDWHDARTAHPDPDAEWDRTNGRIYRIAPHGRPRAAAIDFSTVEPRVLVELHAHANQWYVRRARQELARRYAAPVNDPMLQAEAKRLANLFRETAANANDETRCLEALWSLHVLGGFDEETATRLLTSRHAAVRAWTIRLLGDNGRLSPELAHRLDEFAEHEPEVTVRQQIACSAARFPAHQALPMINAHINRDVESDLSDPFLPLLWWWAVEKHSVSGREEVMQRFVRPTLWKSRLGRDVLLPKLGRRYTAEGSIAGLDAVVRLLRAAPSVEARSSLWSAVLLGWREQARGQGATEFRNSASRHEIATIVLEAWRAAPNDDTLLALGISLGLEAPKQAAIEQAFQTQANVNRRVALFDLLAIVVDPALRDRCLEVVESNQPEPVRSAALRSVARWDEPRLGERLVALHQRETSAAFRSQLRDTLLARSTWALAWLQAVDRKAIPASETPLEQIRRVALLGDPQLDALVFKHWGKLDGATREEKLAEVRRLNNDLRAGVGDGEQGRELFKKHCATCHALFGEGAKVGPDLTTANRQDRDFLLVSLVDPSSVIRKEYVSLVIETTNGQTWTGLPIARDDAAVTLVDSRGERRVIPMAEIEDMHESPLSLMPDNLYLQFKPQQLRDLFAYLQSKR